MNNKMNSFENLPAISSKLDRFENLLDRTKNLESSSRFTMDDIFTFWDLGLDISDIEKLDELLIRADSIPRKVKSLAEKTGVRSRDILIVIKNEIDEFDLFKEIEQYIDRFKSESSDPVFDKYITNLRQFVTYCYSG